MSVITTGAASAMTNPIGQNLNNGYMIKVLGRVANELFPVSNFEYWENVTIAGGYALDLMFGTKTCNDIDMFIFNADKQKVKEIANRIKELIGGTVYMESKSVITLRNHMGTKIQIINTSNKKTAEEVVDEFDINICKVYFDGISLKYHPSAVEELRNKVIDLQKMDQTIASFDRVTKYAMYKGWKLQNVSAVTKNMDPLYFFKECHAFDKLFQNLFLLNNDLLKRIYNMVFIRMNASLNNVGNYELYDELGAGTVIAKAQATYRDIGLSSVINNLPLIVDQKFNKFGLPDILYRIKTGNYTFEELFESMDTDISGFNVSCYMIMYEPNEDKVLEYFENTEKFSSKNMNKYDLSYVELAALMNRLKLVKKFLRKDNYENIMKIAVHEDNKELYLFTYKMISSEERYKYKKEELLRMGAYSICEELYGLSEEEKQEQQNNTTSDSDKLFTELDVLAGVGSIEEFIKFCNENKEKTKQIESYLIKRSEKKFKDIEGYDQFMSDVELMLYNYEKKKQNDCTDNIFNRFLMNFYGNVNDAKAKVTVQCYPPFSDMKSKYVAIRMKDGYLDEAYDFGITKINQLIILLDNVKLIEKNKNKQKLDKLLVSYRDELGPNLKRYMEQNSNRSSNILYYSKILGNTAFHDIAYEKGALAPDYSRAENAIGYTPDDVIIFRTIEDYHNKAVPNSDRSMSVRNINRAKPIVPFTKSTDAATVREVIPEIFEFRSMYGENVFKVEEWETV